MIKSNKGNVRIKGKAEAVLADYSMLTRAIANALVKSGDSEIEAKEMITNAFNISFMTNEEIVAKQRDTLWQILELAQEELRKETVEENE